MTRVVDMIRTKPSMHRILIRWVIEIVIVIIFQSPVLRVWSNNHDKFPINTHFLF